MPTNGFSTNKPLKVKLLAGEQKATEFCSSFFSFFLSRFLSFGMAFRSVPVALAWLLRMNPQGYDVSMETVLAPALWSFKTDCYLESP